MLVLAPHPDDETLGCGGLLARAADQGLRPRVAFLTNGAALRHLQTFIDGLSPDAQT